MSTKKYPSILLFDGVCNFCNSSVQFVLQRDAQGNFCYASLQSDTGQAYLTQYQLPTADFDTMVLIEGDVAYTKSTAALRIARQLDGRFWKLVGLFMFLPTPIRDAVYTIIAKNRYRIWGKQEDRCIIPTPKLAKTLLDDNAR